MHSGSHPQINHSQLSPITTGRLPHLHDDYESTVTEQSRLAGRCGMIFINLSAVICPSILAVTLTAVKFRSHGKNRHTSGRNEEWFQGHERNSIKSKACIQDAFRFPSSYKPL